MAEHIPGFDERRWARPREAAGLWWQGRLDRPLIHATLGGADPGGPKPRLQGDMLAAVYDLSIPAADIVDVWDYDLRCRRYAGDGFPVHWPYLGPIYGVAWFGAIPDPRGDTVWFHPDRDRQIADLHFVHDEDNRWLRRAVDLFTAAAERWAGQVVIGMPGAMNGLDMISVFRPGEKLLLDLVDHPAEVQRCLGEIRTAFARQWELFAGILGPTAPGWSSWDGMFCPAPYHTFQCDFAYMISPGMFAEFVRDDLATCCGRVGRSFYHLDGVGQLPHLDSLLGIDALGGVQWVPGAGRAGLDQWPAVFRRIRDAGKLVQLYGGIDVLDAVAGQVGSPEGLVLLTGGHASQAGEWEKALARYGVL